MKKTVKQIGHLSNSRLRNSIYDTENLCPCLTAAMGLGGGFVPLIIERNYEQNIENQTSNKDGICSV